MPVRFELRTDAGEVWARMVVKRGDRDVRRTVKAVRARRAFQNVFTAKAAPEGQMLFETEPERGRQRGVDPAVARLAEAVRACGIWAVLTGSGYRYYLGTFEPAMRLPQLASAYAVMFYLGSITRYKPYDFDRIVSGRYAWLVNEFLATQPRQFLYVAASTLAGVDVVRPYAMT